MAVPSLQPYLGAAMASVYTSVAESSVCTVCSLKYLSYLTHTSSRFLRVASTDNSKPLNKHKRRPSTQMLLFFSQVYLKAHGCHVRLSSLCKLVSDKAHVLLRGAESRLSSLLFCAEYMPC